MVLYIICTKSYREAQYTIAIQEQTKGKTSMNRRGRRKLGSRRQTIHSFSESDLYDNGKGGLTSSKWSAPHPIIFLHPVRT